MRPTDRWWPLRIVWLALVAVAPPPPAVQAAPRDFVVAWYEVVFQPVQAGRRFYAAREAVTDGDGQFEIPRLTGVPPGAVFLDPQIKHFVPGYVWNADRV